MTKRDPGRDGRPAKSGPNADRRSGHGDPAPAIAPGGYAAHGSTAADPDPPWSLLALRPSSPFRPPDWRSLLAAEIAGHPDPQAAARLARWADARVVDLVRLGEQPPPGHPLAAARELRSPDRHQLRVEVEARLLAGQSDGVIAAATGVGVDAVGWHHDAAFDCRSRLHAPGLIRHLFLGDMPRGDGRGGPPLEWLRWYGYHGGVAVLEVLLDAFRHWEADRLPPRGGTADELARRARRLYAQAGLLARSIPVEKLGRAEARALLALAAGRRGAGHPGRRYTSSSDATAGRRT